MNRAKRRRQEKLAKKQAKYTQKNLEQIVEKYWRDTWRFYDWGLRISRHDRHVIDFLSL